jgi:hypothetical protein
VVNLQGLLDKIGAWLLSISAAGIISGLCTLAAPESAKKSVKFAGALLIILAVLFPLRSFKDYNPAKILESYEDILSRRISSISKTNSKDACEIMAEQAEDYIEIKAAGLGLNCEATVHVITDKNGAPFPYSAMLVYETFPLNEELEEMKAMIRDVLGIPLERQIHKQR